MKRIFLSLTLVIFVIPFGMSQDLPSYVPTDGLIAYYPFNGNANDESGNGNHGTVNGATLTSDRNDVQNSSYMFENSNISIENQFYNNGFENYTINIWFLTNNPTKTMQCLLNTIPHDGEGIGYNHENALNTFSHGKNSNVSQHLWDIFSSNPFGFEVQQNMWYMLTIIKNSSNYSYYVNNSLEKTSTASSTAENQNTGLTFGSTSLGSEYINGKLDDIGIWNRALSEGEIQNLYTSSTGDILLNGVVSAENNQIKNVANPTESLDAVNLGFLTEKLNELTQKINELESLIDSSQVQPLSEYVLSFDANNYVRFPNIGNYDNLDSMTIEFWAYLNSSPCTDESIIGTEYFSTGWHFYPGMWAMIGGTNDAETMSNVDAHGSCENYIESSKWFHIALQYNSKLNENQWKLYIDGDLHEQKTGNLSSIGDGGDIVINRHTWGSGTPASSRLSGYIDEVRFSKIARYSGNFTPETKQLQNDENTLLLLNFENTTSNQVIDSSSNQNHGIINGTVNYVKRNEIEDSNAAN